MAIHDDLAAIGKLDFEHPAGGQFKIQIGPTGFQSVLDFFQRQA